MKGSKLSDVVGRRALAAAGASLLAGSAAHAAFVSYVVTSETTSLNGQNLVVYTLAARFNGTQDTVFAAFGLSASMPEALTGFWHKDMHGNPATNGTLSQSSGTWDPAKTGSTLNNRPYDSYLTIGSVARSVNSTGSFGIWADSNNDMPANWTRPDLPNNYGLFGWVNKDTDNGQGTVGNSPGLPSTDVRLGQFVLSEGHQARTLSLTIKYCHEYSLTDNHFFATGQFTLGAIPAPGAFALLALSGFISRSRRR